MFHLLLICLAVLSASTANACLCDIRPLKESIERFPFIAHARIVEKLGARDTIHHKKEGITHINYNGAPVLIIEIIELFKGTDTTRRITEYDVNSSCEIGVDAGEEWIIFAEYFERGKVFGISACTPSLPYRNEKGEKYWHGAADGLLTNLRTHFNHVLPDNGFNGLHKQLYKNGKMEWETSYINGQLDGNRKIYYAGGQLYYDEHYVNGRPEGTHKKYYEDGRLYRESVFKNGKCVQYKEWGHPYNRKRYRGLYEEFYYYDSTYSILKQYDEKGRLDEEREEDQVDDRYVITHYYPSGKVEYKFTTWRRLGKTVQLFWNEDGTFDKKRIYLGDKLVENDEED